MLYTQGDIIMTENTVQIRLDVNAGPDADDEEKEKLPASCGKNLSNTD